MKASAFCFVVILLGGCRSIPAESYQTTWGFGFYSIETSDAIHDEATRIQTLKVLGLDVSDGLRLGYSNRNTVLIDPLSCQIVIFVSSKEDLQFATETLMQNAEGQLCVIDE